MRRQSALFLVALVTLSTLAFLPAALGSHDATATGPVVAHGVLADGVRQDATAVALQGNIYLIGGAASRATAAARGMIEFDPASQTQRAIAFPTALPQRLGAVAVANGSTILLFGGASMSCHGEGCSPTHHDGVIEIDPSVPSWKHLVADGQASETTAHMSAARIGSKIYLVGGCDLAAASCSVGIQEYDTLAPGRPSRVASLPHHMGGAAVFSDATRVWIAGGLRADDGTLPSAYVYTFTPGSQTLQEKSDLSTAIGGAASFVVDDRLYLVGGLGQGAETLAKRADILQYNTTSGVSTTLPFSLPASRSGAALAVLSDRAYLLGGEQAQGATADIRQISFATRLVSAIAGGADVANDGRSVVVRFSREIASNAGASGFSMTVNGRATHISAASVSGSSITLTMPSGIANGDVAKITLAPGALSNVDGLPVSSFSTATVTVQTPLHTLPAPRVAASAVWNATGQEALLFAGSRITCETCLDHNVTIYWPANGTVITGPSLGACCAVAVDTAHGVLLVGGPRVGGSDVRRYDRATDAVSSLGTLGLSAGQELTLASAVHGNGRVYVFGGLVAGATRADILSIDPATGAVSAVGALPSPRSGTAAAWLVTPSCPAGCAYVVGGTSAVTAGASQFAEIVKVDPSTNPATVTVLSAALPTPRAGATAVPLQGAFLVLGGTRADGSGITEVVRVAPDSALVTTAPVALATARGAHAAAWTGSTAHLIGGASSLMTTLRSIEVFRPDVTAPTISWTLPAADGLNGWYNTPPTATFSATDDVALGEALRRSNGGAWTPVTTETFPEGTTVLQLMVNDTSNNTATRTLTVNVDSVRPTVVVSGTDGVTTASEALVTFTFSEPMDEASTRAALQGATGWTLSMDAAKRVLTASTSALPHGTSTLTLATTARDAHGAALAAPATRTITREAPAPAAPPPPPPAPSSPPAAPVGLTASVNGLDVTLLWQEPAANGAPVTRYIVERDGVVLGETTATSFQTVAPARGRSYSYSVKAVNAEGVGAPATVSVGIGPVSSIAIAGATPGADGWSLTRPNVTLTADPAEAEIHYDLGNGLYRYAQPLLIPEGRTTLTWRAVAGNLQEPSRSQEFLVDSRAPILREPTASQAAPGQPLALSVHVTEAHSGLASVEAVLAGAGAAIRVPLTSVDGERWTASFAPPAGPYDVSFEARDRAGHGASAPAGRVVVADAVATPTPAPTPGTPLEPHGRPSEQGSTVDPPAVSPVGPDFIDPAAASPGENPQQPAGGQAAEPAPATEPAAVVIRIRQPDDVGASGDAGFRGIVTIELDGIDDLSGISVYVGDVLLSREERTTTWDTSSVPDGVYTIEVRRDRAPLAAGEVRIQSSHPAVLASLTIRVVNPELDIGAAAGEVVAGAATLGAVIALSAAASSSVTTASTTAAGASWLARFDVFGFAQEVVVDAGQDRLLDRTKERAAIDRKRRIRSAVAAIVSLSVLAGLWAISEMEAWTLSDWLLALPVIGLAAAVVTAMKYVAEGALAWVTHATPRIRLWVAGTLSLVVSSAILHNPFGYPGYVAETPLATREDRRRIDGLRGLATIAGAAAFMLPFLALANVAPWQFVSAGILIAATNAATTTMPFAPLPGKDVWRWNKPISIAVSLAGFALYALYVAALVPFAALWAISLVGAGIYVVALVRFRQVLGRAPRRIPVSVPVQVQAEPAPAPLQTPEQKQ